MAFNFPDAPTVGQVFTPIGGVTYIWNGYGWAAQTPDVGMLIIPRVITTTQTYAPTPNLVFAQVECVGGGGGGGGLASTSSYYQGAAGGGGGGYSRRLLTGAQIGASQLVTVGLGGAGAPSSPGGSVAGGVTSFGSLVVANGGGGGDVYIPGLGGSVIGAVGDIIAAGSPGGAPSYGGVGYAYGHGGHGGSSVLGGGGRSQNGTTAPGENAFNYGGGGGGAFGANYGAAVAGGNGSAGVCYILEYVGGASFVGGNVSAAGVPNVGQLAIWSGSTAIQGVNQVPGGRVQLSTQTVGAPVNQIVFTGLSSAYDEYEIHVIGARPASDSALIFQISEDGGANFISGIYYYGYTAGYATGTGNASGAAGTASLPISAGNIAAFTGTGSTAAYVTVHLFEPSAAMGHLVRIESSTHDPVVSITNMNLTGYWSTGNAYNAVRILFNGYQAVRGKFVLYGIQK
jgi:hypothetical protein